jgi:exosortase K
VAVSARRGAVLAAIAATMFLLKWHYATASAQGLRWILGPTSGLVSLLSGATFEFEAGAGYLSRERLFLIEKSCAGVNFMIAAVGLAGFGLSRRAHGWRSGARIVAQSLGLGYAAAVVVNTARILLAMSIASAGLASGWWTDTRIHRLEGIVVSFAGLALLDAMMRARRAAPAPEAP